jgi:predicted phosphodiesterase
MLFDPIETPFRPFEKWERMVSKTNEGSYVDHIPEFVDTEIIDLPDKDILAPYTAIWYRKKVKFKNTNILHINPDDGARIYYQGGWIDPLHDNIYSLPASADSTWLVLRVMNQAMHGGLRHAKIAKEEDFAMYFEQLNQRSIRKNIWQHYISIDSPGEKDLQQLEKSFAENTTPDTAMAYFRSNTFFTIPPYALLFDSTLKIAWQLNNSDTLELHYRTSDNNKIITSKTLFNKSLQYVELPLTEAHDGLTCWLQHKDHYTDTFRIANILADTLTIGCWGDSQGGWDTFRKIVGIQLEDNVQFSIGLGDLVSNGSSEEQYQYFTRSLTKGTQVLPTLIVPGNHDYDGVFHNFNPTHLRRYTLEEQGYKSFNIKDYYFLAIDFNEFFPLSIPEESEQFQWMYNQINSKAWQNAKIRFLMLHQPPYSQGWPGYHGAPMVKALVDSLAEKYRIDFVLAGHTHDYERLSKQYGNHTTHFVISGTGGGNIEPSELSEYPVMDTVIKSHLYTQIKLIDQQVLLKAIQPNGDVVDKLIINIHE